MLDSSKTPDDRRRLSTYERVASNAGHGVRLTLALLQWSFDPLGRRMPGGGPVVVNKDLADLAYAAHAASRDSQLRPRVWDMLRTTAAVGSGRTRRYFV